MKQATLILEDGFPLTGQSFGAERSVFGELVFNTGMTGYSELLTDPSYCGQILMLTYPLVGNYGIPSSLLSAHTESSRIQVAGLIVSSHCANPSHHQVEQTLSEWLISSNVPALSGIDTRWLTLKIRQQGTLLAQIACAGHIALPWQTPVASQVSCREPILHGSGSKRIILVDCGLKTSILNTLLSFPVEVLQVPWDDDWSQRRCDGVVVSNGPGDPMAYPDLVKQIQLYLEHQKPFMGICLGSQLLALAAGAKTYRMPYGHRGQNQPVQDVFTQRCWMTSQNHGYAVDKASLPPDWQAWFVNLNDGSNEGFKHLQYPFYGLQFHPEAAPGPQETLFLLQNFMRSLCP